MRTLSIILLLVTSSTYGADPKPVDPNKSASDYYSSMVDNFCKLKTAEGNSMKNFAEYLQKMITIEELQEKIRALKLDNEMKEAKQFYEKRKLYTDNKAKRVAPKPVKSLADKPVKMASLSRYKGLPWPTIFEEDPFLQTKTQIDRLFSERSLENSGVGSKNYREIQRYLDDIKELLVKEMDDMKPMEYMIYKKFLDSVSYESSTVSSELKDLVVSK